MYIPRHDLLTHLKQPSWGQKKTPIGGCLGLDSGLAPECWASSQDGGVQVYLPIWLFASDLFVLTTVTRWTRRNKVLVGERRVRRGGTVKLAPAF